MTGYFFKLTTINYQQNKRHSVTQGSHGVSQWKSAKSASSAFHSISRTIINKQRATPSVILSEAKDLIH